MASLRDREAFIPGLESTICPVYVHTMLHLILAEEGARGFWQSRLTRLIIEDIGTK